MKHRIWTVVATAGVLVGASIATVVDGSANTDNRKPSPRSTGPVHAEVQAVSLTASDEGDKPQLPQRDTKPFSMLGVTWTDPATRVEGTVKARTKDAKTKAWSSWFTLAAEADGRTENRVSGVRGSTEPTWVGLANGVEVRVDRADGSSSGLPKGLRLDLISPGAGPSADESVSNGTLLKRYDAVMPHTPKDPPWSPRDRPDSEGVPPDSDVLSTRLAKRALAVNQPTGPLPTALRPFVNTRAAWGANETYNNQPAKYDTEVKAVFVHHTTGAHNYSCAESPAIVRSLQAYHVKSLGWKDIGYNFLVDKCGTIFEGREGGVDRPVVGAHTMGFNANTAGVAVIGQHDSTEASAEARAAVASVAAWKLGQYGHDPLGSVRLTAGIGNGKFAAGQSVVFNRISGHRDGFPTACPGNSLYGQLPAIRALAGGASSQISP